MAYYIKVTNSVAKSPHSYKLRSELSDDLTDLAIYLDIVATAYCNEHLTDGFLPKAAVSELIFSKKTEKLAQSLVKVGLWEEQNDHFILKNYVKNQETSEKVEQKKEQNRERQQRWRDKQKQENPGSYRENSKSLAHTDSSSNTVTNALRNEDVTNGVTIAYTDTDTDTDTYKKKKKQKEKNVTQKPKVVGELCDQLADLIERNTDRRPSVGEKWLIEMDRLIRLDDRDPAQIGEVIDWCQKNSFWKSNILSAPKLREHYDTLLVQMRDDHGTAGQAVKMPGNPQSGGPSWQRNMLRHEEGIDSQALYERTARELAEAKKADETAEQTDVINRDEHRTGKEISL